MNLIPISKGVVAISCSPSLHNRIVILSEARSAESKDLRLLLQLQYSPQEAA